MSVPEVDMESMNQESEDHDMYHSEDDVYSYREHEDDDDEEEEGEGETAPPLMEIREFIDSNGTPTRSDVVNISQTSASLAASTSAEQNAAIDAVLEKLQSRVVGAGGAPGGSTAAGEGPGATQPLDEHSAFVKELAELSAASSRRQKVGAVRPRGGEPIRGGVVQELASGDGDLSFLDALEREEEAAQAAARGHVFGSAKPGGWKKGFLGGGGNSGRSSSGGGSKAPAKPKVAQPLPAASVSESTPAPAIHLETQIKNVRFEDSVIPAVPSVALGGQSSTSNATATTTTATAATSAPTASSTSEKPRPRPAAFSGTIMERF